MGKTKAIPFIQGRLEAGSTGTSIDLTHHHGSLFQTIPKRFQDGPEKHLFDSNEKMHPETGEYCPIQTDATRTAVKDNPGKDATCRQSEAISVLYGLFVDPEP